MADHESKPAPVPVDVLLKRPGVSAAEDVAKRAPLGRRDAPPAPEGAKVPGYRSRR